MAIFTTNNYKVIDNDKPLDGRLVMTQAEINAINDDELDSYPSQFIYNSTTGWYHHASVIANPLFKVEAGDTIKFFGDNRTYLMNGSNSTDISLGRSIILHGAFDSENVTTSDQPFIAIANADKDGYDRAPGARLTNDELRFVGLDCVVQLGVDITSVNNYHYNAGYLRIGNIINNPGPQDYLYLNIGDVSSNQTYAGNIKGVSMIGTGLEMTSTDVSNYANNALIVGQYNDDLGHTETGDGLFIVGGGTNDSNRKNIFEIRTDGIEIKSKVMIDLKGMDERSDPAFTALDQLATTLDFSNTFGEKIYPFTINKSTVSTTKNVTFWSDATITDIIIRINEAYPADATMTITCGSTAILNSYPIGQLKTGDLAIEHMYSDIMGPISVAISGSNITSGSGKVFVKSVYGQIT